MLEFPTVEQNLGSYIDARFPIIYIHTFEKIKVDRYISAAAGRKKILEWNGAKGFVDFGTKSTLISEGQTLETTLAFLIKGKELHRKLFVIKDVDRLFGTGDSTGGAEPDRIVALLKEAA